MSENRFQNIYQSFAAYDWQKVSEDKKEEEKYNKEKEKLEEWRKEYDERHSISHGSAINHNKERYVNDKYDEVAYQTRHKENSRKKSYIDAILDFKEEK